MRFKSKKVDGFTIFAVTGVNAISFAIHADAEARRNLLGFTVDRTDFAENHHMTMPGFKVFRSLVPEPHPHLLVSTHDHPIQSLLWDDFTAKEARTYEYQFRPVRGTPYHLDRSAAPLSIKVRTEPLYTSHDHDVFFNRGVASSQAYERKFGNLPPYELKPKSKQEAAIQWLARDLDDAILKFIAGAGKEDSLLCCFYEFHYPLVVEALAAARKKVGELKIIIDAKENGRVDKAGKVQEPFPRAENLKAIRRAGIPSACIIQRDANASDIQHNKFMVILRGPARTPKEVWTGSTNISEGGVTGQTNVGHWVRDESVAVAFKAYWDLLSGNPGALKGDDRTTSIRKKAAYRAAVEAIGKVPTSRDQIAPGTTTIFSPRSGDSVLKLYVDLVDHAEDLSCITLAFGVNDLFKNALRNNTAQDHLTFLLLEQKDNKNARSTKPFVLVNASNNVYKAWGAYLRDPVYQWAKETNAKLLRINSHVGYIHSKFLLRDPLGQDPIVVTGSANFSVASTNANDENMIVIRGNKRVADIYFTEFNRLFNHFYFRAVAESRREPSSDASLFLAETPNEWLARYAPGRLGAKRLDAYSRMRGIVSL